MTLTQRQQVLERILKYCDEIGSRTFTAQDFYRDCLDDLVAQYNWQSKTPDANFKRITQELRDEGFLHFSDDGRGIYSLTISSIDLLKHEREAIEEAGLGDLLSPDKLEDTQASLGQTKPTIQTIPEKREYFMETYVRNKGWVKKARDFYGSKCMIADCKNAFKKANGLFYIEVHHIIPMAEFGAEELSNLSTLCAHHHRMAHFANETTKTDLRDYLLREVENRLRA